jgi:two-component system sensor histidine kinase ChiS
MPDLSGLDAARQLRAAGLACPIIALSASLGADDRDIAFESGFTAYLVKPIARADLLAAVERYLTTA